MICYLNTIMKAFGTQRLLRAPLGNNLQVVY
mgnify:CR=1 FL=1